MKPKYLHDVVKCRARVCALETRGEAQLVMQYAHPQSASQNIVIVEINLWECLNIVCLRYFLNTSKGHLSYELEICYVDMASVK